MPERPKSNVTDEPIWKCRKCFGPDHFEIIGDQLEKLLDDLPVVVTPVGRHYDGMPSKILKVIGPSSGPMNAG
jgi:hypothetical protein